MCEQHQNVCQLLPELKVDSAGIRRFRLSDLAGPDHWGTHLSPATNGQSCQPICFPKGHQRVLLRFHGCSAAGLVWARVSPQGENWENGPAFRLYNQATSGLRGLQMFKRIFVLVAAIISFAPAFGAELVPVEKQKFEFTTFADKPGLRVMVARQMVLKQGGMFGSMGYRWVLKPGTYRDVRQAVIDGHEVVILPVIETLFGKPSTLYAQNSAGALGACYQVDGNFIAIQVGTGNVLKRGLLHYEIASNCGGGFRMQWHSSVSSILEPGAVQLAWGEDLVKLEAIKAQHQVKSALLAEQLRDDATRAGKLQIGARICRTQDGVGYVGYTEAVSPDNGKIQIRVAEAMYGGHPGLRPGGFQPSIIWAHPDAWELCD